MSKLPRMRLAGVLLTLVVGALVAGSAWTSASPDSRGFVCDNGDRFIVEFLADHVRVRHGSGVFALAEVKPGHIWSDGRMLLQAGRSTATLELPGTGQRQQCVVAAV